MLADPVPTLNNLIATCANNPSLNIFTSSDSFNVKMSVFPPVKRINFPQKIFLRKGLLCEADAGVNDVLIAFYSPLYWWGEKDESKMDLLFRIDGFSFS